MEAQNTQEVEPKARSFAMTGLGAAISSRPLLVRWILAGPVAIIATLAIMVGMTKYLPEGAARLDNVAFPVILTPLIWAFVFFYALLEKNLPRAILVVMGLIVGNLGFWYWSAS